MKLIQKVKNSDFLKDTFILSFGTLLSQIVSIIFYPILARIFTPGDFGLLAMITSGVTIFSITSLRYEAALILTKNKKDSINLIVLSIIVATAILFLATLIFFVLDNSVNLKVENSQYLYLVPLLSLCTIIFTCYNEWCVKYKLFVNLSSNKILSSVVTILPKLSFGFYHIGYGLILGEVIGRILTAMIGVTYLFRKEQSIIKEVSFSNIKCLSKEFINFPKFIFTGQLLNTLGGQLPILFIGSFFSVDEVGYFSMALTLILMPSTLISLSIRDVFRQRVMQEIEDSGSCSRIYKKAIFVLFILSFFGFSVLFFLIPCIFDFFLGPQWSISIYYSRLMIPFVFISFVSEVVNSIYILTRKQKNETIWQFLYFSSSILTILITFIFKTMESFVISYSVTRLVIHLINIYWTNKIVHAYDKYKN